MVYWKLTNIIRYEEEYYVIGDYESKSNLYTGLSIRNSLCTMLIMSEEIKKGENWRRGYMQGVREKEQEIIVLRSDIQRAIGRMQGLGFPDVYLEKKYNT